MNIRLHASSRCQSYGATRLVLPSLAVAGRPYKLADFDLLAMPSVRGAVAGELGDGRVHLDYISVIPAEAMKWAVSQ